jgi:thiosulfate/3-mercaptopyruvate sulfurtransferase
VRSAKLLVIAAGLTALPVASAAAQGVFVSPEQAEAERAAGRHIRFVQVGQLDAGHIAGSVIMQVSDVAVTRDGIPNELRPLEELDEAFESRGIGDSVSVVVYGDPLAAARVWLTLDLLGHPDARLLDGGLTRWKAERRALGEVDAKVRRVPFTPRLRQERLTDADWILAHLTDPAVLLVDARPPGEYAGTQQSMQVPRPGHIPGARSVFWRRLLQSDSMPALRDRAELRQLLALPRGATDFVAYCRTGYMASMLYAVSRELGLPVKLYDPSFVAWSGRGDLPVEQGPPSSTTR